MPLFTYPKPKNTVLKLDAAAPSPRLRLLPATMFGAMPVKTKGDPVLLVCEINIGAESVAGATFALIVVEPANELVPVTANACVEVVRVITAPLMVWLAVNVFACARLISTLGVLVVLVTTRLPAVLVTCVTVPLPPALLVVVRLPVAVVTTYCDPVKGVSIVPPKVVVPTRLVVLECVTDADMVCDPVKVLAARMASVPASSKAVPLARLSVPVPKDSVPVCVGMFRPLSVVAVTGPSNSLMPDRTRIERGFVIVMCVPAMAGPVINSVAACDVVTAVFNAEKVVPNRVNVSSSAALDPVAVPEFVNVPNPVSNATPLDPCVDADAPIKFEKLECVPMLRTVPGVWLMVVEMICESVEEPVTVKPPETVAAVATTPPLAASRALKVPVVEEMLPVVTAPSVSVNAPVSVPPASGRKAVLVKALLPSVPLALRLRVNPLKASAPEPVRLTAPPLTRMDDPKSEESERELNSAPFTKTFPMFIPPPIWPAMTADCVASMLRKTCWASCESVALPVHVEGRKGPPGSVPEINEPSMNGALPVNVPDEKENVPPCSDRTPLVVTASPGAPMTIGAVITLVPVVFCTFVGACPNAVKPMTDAATARILRRMFMVGERVESSVTGGKRDGFDVEIRAVKVELQ